MPNIYKYKSTGMQGPGANLDHTRLVPQIATENWYVLDKSLMIMYFCLVSHSCRAIGHQAVTMPTYYYAWCTSGIQTKHNDVYHDFRLNSVIYDEKNGNELKLN